MQLDRFTIKSQEALQEAQRIAREHSHQEVDGEHLLLAMIGQAESLIPDLLEKIGVAAGQAQARAGARTGPPPQGPGRQLDWTCS